MCLYQISKRKVAKKDLYEGYFNGVESIASDTLIYPDFKTE